MAKAVVTIRIMPESPDTDLVELEGRAIKTIKEFAGNTDTKTEIKPLAFGLKSMDIFFMMDESKGSTEPLEKSLEALAGISSIEVTDVRRALG